MMPNWQQPTAYLLLAIVLLAACSTGTRWEAVETLSGRESWSRKAPMPMEISEVAVAAAARSGVAGALYQGRIFVAGGACLDKRTYAEIEAYDLRTSRWMSYTPMTIGRHGFGAAAVGRNLYFAAGAVECGGGGRSGDLLVFN